MIKTTVKNIILLLFILTIISCERNQENITKREINITEILGSESDSGFRKATERIGFKFPEDHGSHDEFRTEWWYFTGNVRTKEGREIGYQFTIFRTALTPGNVKDSGWASNQIYMGHFAITDISSGDFYYTEKFSRTGNGLAGAEAKPLRIWIEDWRIEEIKPNQEEKAGNNFPAVKIFAGTEEYEIELTLIPQKRIILQGDGGLSRKSEEEGNASYYYSVTRIGTEGRIKIKGDEYEVRGSSWLDREWSTSALSSEQKGWDWFSLQLDNGYEIMYYQMRKKDGTIDKYSKGSIILPSGEKENLYLKDVKLKVSEYMKNDEGVEYPSGWELKIPSKETDLTIRPAIKNQELKLSVRYWEGSVRIAGKMGGKEVSGMGYVEMTGYVGIREP